MEYKASNDITIQIITISVIVLFTFLGYKSLMGLIHADGNTTLIMLHSMVLFFLTGILLFCYLLSPQKYSVNEDQLIIHRPFSDKIIGISTVKEIRLVDKSELKGMIRTFGVGGLFGNYGKYNCSKLGNITMYGTQNKNFVLIRTEKLKILLTPDDLSIVDDVKNKINKNH